MSETRPTISIIVGSARPVRVGRQLGDAVADIIREAVDADVRILDLYEIALPMLDEPLMAALGQYQNPHTLAWAEQISSSDAVVFLTPQYNAGYPASLKNAIDYLFAEWRGRPSAIVSYGGHGGAKSAQQLRAVLEFIGADLVDAQPQLVISPTDYTPEWNLADPVDVVARFSEQLRTVALELEAEIARQRVGVA